MTNNFYLVTLRHSQVVCCWLSVGQARTLARQSERAAAPVTERLQVVSYKLKLDRREGPKKLRRLEPLADNMQGMRGEHPVEFPHDPRRGFEPAYLVHLHPERMIIEPDSARRQFHLRLAGRDHA